MSATPPQTVRPELVEGLSYSSVHREEGQSFDKLRTNGGTRGRRDADLDELCAGLRDLAVKDDMIVCMGAGDITKWAAALADGVCAARARRG